jgi:hypothetical protein
MAVKQASRPKAKHVLATIAANVPANTALPDYLRNYRGPTGAENIDREDITIPRLKIAQAIADEVKNGQLQEGDLYLNVTGEALWSPGDKPLKAVIVAITKEYILWRPRKDGGGILARAKPVMHNGTKRYQWDKPNQSFDVRIDGKVKVTWKTKRYIDEDGLGNWGTEIPGNKDSSPAATEHHNYVVVLPDRDNIVAAISMTRSGVKRAKDWNTKIKMRGASTVVHSTQWLIETTDDQNSNGDRYKNWLIKAVPGFVAPEDFAEYDLLAKSFRENNFNVDLTESDATTSVEDTDM